MQQIAAAQIQSIVKGRAQRRMFNAVKAMSVAIQSRFRGFVARKATSAMVQARLEQLKLSTAAGSLAVSFATVYRREWGCDWISDCVTGVGHPSGHCQDPSKWWKCGRRYQCGARVHRCVRGHSCFGASY
jgi:hypothetical protein